MEKNELAARIFADLIASGHWSSPEAAARHAFEAAEAFVAEQARQEAQQGGS